MNTPRKIHFIRDAGSVYGLTAGAEDIPAIESLILEHGPNQWNHLPEDDVRRHVASIEAGATLAVVAFSKPLQETVGVVTYEISRRYHMYQPPRRSSADHGYIAEAVVHPDFAGRGLGTELFSAAIQDLVSKGMKEIYAMRHADNDPSRRMMDKSGMRTMAEFDDPDIRPSGSRRTTVMRFIPEN